MKKGERLLLLAGILLSIGVLIFSAWKLRGIYGEYQEGEDTYEELSAFVEEPEDTPEDATDEPEAEPSGYLQIDFAGLQAVNPDVIAWIDIPGLSVSYPVVQGEDNSYYLHHLFTGEYNSSGSIFADCHNQPDFTDQNTIIYGHNMKNGSMFGTLSHYQDQALWEENPYFYLYVPGKVMEYQIFSCYAGYVGSEAYTYAFPEADDFQNFLGKIRSYAGYDTGVEVGETDRVVTLSTCVSSRRDYRYIVHGKLKEVMDNERNIH